MSLTKKESLLQSSLCEDLTGNLVGAANENIHASQVVGNADRNGFRHYLLCVICDYPSGPDAETEELLSS